MPLIDKVEYFNKVFVPKHSSMNCMCGTQNDDPILQKLIEFCQHGWPAYKSEHQSLTFYFNHQGHLTVDKEVLLYDGRLVIHAGLQPEILNIVHEGHQGIARCREGEREKERESKERESKERYMVARDEW